MVSFRAQFEEAQKSSLLVRSLSLSARARVNQLWTAHEVEASSRRSLQLSLESAVRAAYSSGAALGVAHLSAQAEIPGWSPRAFRRPTKTEYLSGLLKDVRRNVREYWAGPREDRDRTRAISRISHSAGVAASRGYTDALLAGAIELESSYGFLVFKVWRANFVQHTPCNWCAALEGTSVRLSEEFPAYNGLRVYGDLKGPPRHPNCMCWLAILIAGPGSQDDDVTGQNPPPDSDTMSTDDVKRLRASFFGRILRWLRTLIQKLRGS